MRILLIAYEFPPSASPQSLRWTYLARELSLAGHDVHVLTIDLGGDTPGLPLLPPGVQVHRSHAGPLRSAIARRRRRRHRRDQQQAATSAHEAGAQVVGTITPGWKRFASRSLQRLAEYVWFPDLRGEWLRSGRRALVPLLQHVRPDVVISSHEPATTLQLGLLARNMGFPWIADLGDPVLAPYTLARWRQRAFALEREVCACADRILVTAESAGRLLARRHGRSDGIELLTQGFDDRAVPGPAPDPHLFDPDRLELFYTGSFYSFRSPDALIQAIREHPTARLTVASIVAPASIVQACRSHPDAFRLLGFLPHAETLRLQRQADVLVSIANRDGAQVPGKFYEYLGAGRPILHLRDGDVDAAASVIDRLRRGHVCDNEPQAISGRLGQLAEARRRRQLDAGFHLDAAAVAEFGWSRIAGRLEQVLAEVLRPGPGGSPGRAPVPSLQDQA